MAPGVTKTIRKSPDLPELAPAQLGNLQEKDLRASLSRGLSPVLGLKGRQAKEIGAVSVSGDGPIAPAPGERSENQFRLQVDRQTKASYATYEAAEAAALAVKQNHPIVQVAIYDAKAGVNKVIELPKS